MHPEPVRKQPVQQVRKPPADSLAQPPVLVRTHHQAATDIQRDHRLGHGTREHPAGALGPRQDVEFRNRRHVAPHADGAAQAHEPPQQLQEIRCHL